MHSILWRVQPVAPYPHPMCYAWHASLVHLAWTGRPVDPGAVVRCAPPSLFGGDPGLFFDKCAPSVGARATLAPSTAQVHAHLQNGPVLVGVDGHAMTLRGYTDEHWLLVDTEEVRLPKSRQFEYALGI